MKRRPYLAFFPEGIPTFSWVYGRCAYPQGRPIPPLVHSDWDLFYISEGTSAWELADGIRLTIRKGDFFLLPPFVPVRRRFARTGLKYWYCHFNFRLAPGEISPPFQGDCLGHGQSASVPLTFARREAPAVWQALDQLFRLNKEDGDHPWRYERALIGVVSEIAALAARRTRNRAAGQPLHSGSEPDPRVSVLCARINRSPESPWRVAELAASVGLSPGHLHHLCRRALGKSIKSCIVEARLRKALGLIKAHREGRYLSIKEISTECGFASQHFFGRQFKRAFQISPLAYRKSAMWI